MSKTKPELLESLTSAKSALTVLSQRIRLGMLCCLLSTNSNSMLVWEMTLKDLSLTAKRKEFKLKLTLHLEDLAPQSLSMALW